MKDLLISGVELITDRKFRLSFVNGKRMALDNKSTLKRLQKQIKAFTKIMKTLLNTTQYSIDLLKITEAVTSFCEN